MKIKLLSAIVIIIMIIVAGYYFILKPTELSITGELIGCYDGGGGFININIDDTSYLFYVCNPPCIGVNDLIYNLTPLKNQIITIYFTKDGVNNIWSRFE